MELKVVPAPLQGKKALLHSTKAHREPYGILDHLLLVSNLPVRLPVNLPKNEELTIPLTLQIILEFSAKLHGN